MFKVRIVTTDGKKFDGPSYADNLAGAVKEAESAVEAAGQEIGQIFIKSVEGKQGGIVERGTKGATPTKKRK